MSCFVVWLSGCLVVLLFGFTMESISNNKTTKQQNHKTTNFTIPILRKNEETVY